VLIKLHMRIVRKIFVGVTVEEYEEMTKKELLSVLARLEKV